MKQDESTRLLQAIRFFRLKSGYGSTVEGTMFRPAAVLVVLFGVGGCSRRDDAGAKVDNAVAAVSAPAPKAAPTARPIEKVVEASTLSNAIERAKPYMGEKFDSVDEGTVFLSAWAAKSMTWNDVAVATNETSFALVQKDPDEERGKRVCVPGKIIQIEVAKTEFGKFQEGLLMSDTSNIYKFVGVGSSGTLVEKDRARFCGVVTGKYDYSNSAGGTGHAIKLVGMFDLPQNKAKPE